MNWSIKFRKPLPKLTTQQKTLFRKLGFKRSGLFLFLTALTHPSYASENETKSYQRLEFLGDAVIDLFAANDLFSRHKQWDEGNLTRARASIVSKPALAHSARNIKIGDCMRLGIGEEMSGGRDRDSNLCDIFEAVIGSLFLINGYNHTAKVLDRLHLLRDEDIIEDPKSRLQRICANLNLPQPEYHLNNNSSFNQEHFSCQVIIGNKAYSGSGKTKKSAEMTSAELAIKELISQQ
jgi:ribonuclease III